MCPRIQEAPERFNKNGGPTAKANIHFHAGKKVDMDFYFKLAQLVDTRTACGVGRRFVLNPIKSGQLPSFKHPLFCEISSFQHWGPLKRRLPREAQLPECTGIVLFLCSATDDEG